MNMQEERQARQSRQSMGREEGKAEGSKEEMTGRRKGALGYSELEA